MERLPAGTSMPSQLTARPDLRADDSPPGLEVYQLSQDEGVHNSHIYMESHVFTPDSQRFVFERIPLEGSGRRYSQYLLCDLDDGGRLHVLTDEEGALAPSVDQDGAFMYYLVDESEPGGGRILLRRVSLATWERETLSVIDGPLEEASCPPSHPYRLSTISSDGRRFATSVYLGDGATEEAPFGLLIFALDTGQVRVVELGAAFCNAHPQYSRHPDPPHNRDILVQHNHGCVVDASGQRSKLVGGAGADIHVLRDDGSDLRLLPWGRTGQEYCQGHQAWRGRLTAAVTSTTLRGGGEAPYLEAAAGQEEGATVIGKTGERVATLVEGRPMRVAADRLHDGAAVPGAGEARNEISRELLHPAFCHFAFDPSGTRFVSDTYAYGSRGESRIYAGTLPAEPQAALKVRYLLHPKSSFSRGQHTHPHPFVAPDARAVFFNSDVDGTAEIFMARRFSYPGE